MDDEEPNVYMGKYTVTRSLIQPALGINKPHGKQARAHKNITNVHQEPCAPKIDAVSLLFLIIYYRKSVCDVVYLNVGFEG
jgi:hypothetical protein